MGFKSFVRGLYDGSCCFGGEESAGASFLPRDGGYTRIDARATPEQKAKLAKLSPEAVTAASWLRRRKS